MKGAYNGTDYNVRQTRETLCCPFTVTRSPSEPSLETEPSADARLAELTRWVTRDLGLEVTRIRPASADASFRRYFRIERPSGSLVAMDAPPDRESLEPYMRTSAMLLDIGVNVPRVLEENRARGFLLLTDLGSRLYLTELKAAGFEKLGSEEVVKYRIFNVTPEFLNELRAAGLQNLDPEEVVKARIFNISPDFVRQQKAADPNVTMEDLVRMKIGVGPKVKGKTWN